LFVGDKDEHMDELALREASIEEFAEPLPQVVHVPQRPLRVGAVSLDVGLMVGLTHLVEQILGLAGSIRLHLLFLLTKIELM
jgi:hypothetical protein